jgi:hypothetical protein
LKDDTPEKKKSVSVSPVGLTFDDVDKSSNEANPVAVNNTVHQMRRSVVVDSSVEYLR